MNKSKISGVKATIIKARNAIVKAVTADNLDPATEKNADVWITLPMDMRGLEIMKNNSSILPQCIRAYKNNIAGFGIGVKYKDDVEETPEMKAEWAKITQVLGSLNLDMNTKEVFEHIIESRETYGIAYLEILRNLAGEIVGIEFIKDTTSVQKSLPLPPYIDVEYTINGETEKRPRKFCKYRQQIGGKTVYFKEIGDPRIMDSRTGKHVKELPLEEQGYQANEILEFSIGTAHYGGVRWVGQILGIDGSRKAEGLNNRYFSEGRHIPMMITIEGGTLTDDSFTKLQEYMNGIRGEAGQHAFIVLEAANTDSRTDMEDVDKPKIRIEKLADILQKDELFQDYLDNNRRRVQSAFQLPDLYVGYTTDFNRATSQTAMEVTEEQVFQPERQSLDWKINNKLLAEYKFKYVEAYFKAPTITNPDDITKILNVTERAGGLTPNKAKEIALGLFGETSENYEGDWGDIPLAYTKAVSSVDSQLEQQIQKAAQNNDTEIVAIMKEVRNLLEQGDL